MAISLPLVGTKSQGKIPHANGKHFAAKNRKAADEFAASLRTKLHADLLGRSYSEIARHLNDAGILTVTGRQFYPQTVKNCLERIRGRLEAATGNSELADVVLGRESF
jgi:hypothetical protein